MITDKITNIPLYFKEEPFLKAFDFITGNNLKEMLPGKYEISGNKVFALISEYLTKEPSEGRLEAHKKYLDIQYLISGEELIGYTPYNSQRPVIEYNAEKDVHFFNEPVSFIEMHEGIFAVFYPDDLHMPGIKKGESAPVKKLVIKIAV